jgi:hypothetical protein
MSECQYHEVVAVDRPLTRNEMTELRFPTSLATIKAMTSCNE